MVTVRVSKDENQPEKKMPRRWRKVAGFIFGMAGILLLGGCATIRLPHPVRSGHTERVGIAAIPMWDGEGIQRARSGGVHPA
jgi:hypothetical protein